MSRLKLFEWTLGAGGEWNLYGPAAGFGNVHVWLTARPPYCDRGHWQASVSGLEDIDYQDGFPRYFMDLERAKLEMADWLRWRLKSIPA